ncbi:MAG: eukaryotic-like serine/threonine-protein kinase [Verrucomicrobiota bacterium]
MKASPPEHSASRQIPLIPDHEVLRVIGRGAYGEIWLARSLTGAWRAVKLVYRATFESERAFQREFQGMSSFEPISRAHDGFVDILHVGRTADYLYYIMELADDHVAGTTIDAAHYEPRTLKSDLARHTRLSANDSIQLGLSLTEALQALHACSLTHRDIKPSNIIFIDGIPKLADIGLVAATGQNSFVGTEGYVPPEGPGTPQADIFSLGKLLYEISSGKDRLDFPEIDSQLSERPDKEHLLQLNQVLIKACANDPKKRYASAEAMRQELAALKRGEFRERRQPISRSSVGAFLILILAMVAGLLLWRHNRIPAAADFRGRTTIQTEPAEALVVLADHMQKSPATFDDLETRKYKLRIMKPGYDPIETTLDLSAPDAAQPPIFHLSRSKGRLEISSQPAGAKFLLRSEDGGVSREGIAPQTIGDLPTGKYSLSGRRADWEMHETIEIARGETLHKLFAFVDATVNVTSEPAGAEVRVDGISRGRTPFHLELPARLHELTAHLEGWPDEAQQLSVEAQHENPVHFLFANGSVKITSAPAGATVIANGRDLGKTPLVIEEVKPGPVNYELRLAGYNLKSVPGRVEPQQQLFLAEYLEKSSAPEAGLPWTNSLGMKFVNVGPVRISVWETRVQDYDAYCAATGRRHDPPDFQQGPTHPVVKVNWFDASAFCQWLTEKERQESLIPEGQSYRLPTDVEWSAAVGLRNEGGATPEARDGKIRNEFPWGKQWPLPSGAGNYADKSARSGDRTRGDIIENYADGFGQTAPVGSFKPNALGLYDLGGNVWEWCFEGYKGKGGAGTRDWGVLRGGSWATGKRMELQSSYRNVIDRNDRDVIFGFRCVLATQPQENR